MEKRKFLIVAILLCIVGMNASAQKFGIKGGLNLLSDKNAIGGAKINNTFRIGANVGGVVEFDVDEMFAIESGLMLDVKGSHSKLPVFGGVSDYKIRMWFVDVPILAKVYFEESDIKFFGAVGPVFGIGVTGKYSGSKIKWGSGGDMKRLNAALSIGGGFEVEGIQFGLAYELGLIDIDRSSLVYKTRGLRFSALYFF